ncbi:DUF2442 domain-containing protein [Chryseobacterium koreense]|uniref:DUF2442 domain-containing protein n=1 Tax=Chryseobacterium koreense CCUG 49689 TaxID=1304281 RepID=A0A0J7J3E3_9FLAO|nr:DUF2442 domain-containing protein [Chryseobacterium koreense]KMQ72549.1 hypothetical protein ACM44_00120 [Chryseobacterium koreense CCUG 49689]MBB5332928.1 hypothetical protein [Chryseobacterium koreense]
MNNIKLTKASYVSEYTVNLEFSTNEKMTVNLQRFIEKPEFSGLKNQEIFKDFKIEDGNLVWKNGAHFAADFLYGLPNETELSCS